MVVFLHRKSQIHHHEEMLPDWFMKTPYLVRDNLPRQFFIQPRMLKLLAIFEKYPYRPDKG